MEYRVRKAMMNTVTLPDGTRLPALGLGTWQTGESAASRAQEVAAVRLALELGYRVLDTAEMYAEGGAEEVLGQALAESLRAGTVTREQVFVVSKVYPHNASRTGVAAACERSRRRLMLDHIDLYLLHWPGPHPLRDTVAGFEALQSQGRMTHWGVSNFDTDDLAQLSALPGGARCAANQVYYSPSTRGAEFDLLPWQRARSMPLMAYCPLDQGDLAQDAVLQTVADRHGATASQIALAWLIARGGMMPIPKAVREPHLRANLAAADLVLNEADLSEIEQRFPAPQRKQVLAMR
jgi:diketogulonate reductase-like aldo/keto reductase